MYYVRQLAPNFLCDQITTIRHSAHAPRRPPVGRLIIYIYIKSYLCVWQNSWYLSNENRRRRSRWSRGPCEQRRRRPQLPAQRVPVGTVLDHRLTNLVAALQVYSTGRYFVGTSASINGIVNLNNMLRRQTSCRGIVSDCKCDGYGIQFPMLNMQCFKSCNVLYIYAVQSDAIKMLRFLLLNLTYRNFY